MFADAEILTSAPAGEHLVQIHRKEEDLLAAVNSFAIQGLKENEKVVLVGSSVHLNTLRMTLGAEGINIPEVEAAGQLHLLDGEALLAQFMVEKMPNAALFRSTLGRIIESLEPRTCKVRIWGEMVNFLWEKEQRAAAIDLEEFWNRLGKEFPFFLFCTYLIDPFLPELPKDPKEIEKIFTSHSCSLPLSDYSRIEKSFDLALEEVLGPAAALMKKISYENSKSTLNKMPPLQALIARLKQDLPISFHRILSRARIIYETS